jgi:hypothetical protein
MIEALSEIEVGFSVIGMPAHFCCRCLLRIGAAFGQKVYLIKSHEEDEWKPENMALLSRVLHEGQSMQSKDAGALP